MEEDVDEVLIAPRDVILMLLVVGNDVVHPVRLQHPSHVHQHHARVNS